MNFKIIILFFLLNSCGVKNDPRPAGGSKFQSYEKSFIQKLEGEDNKNKKNEKEKNQ